MADETMGTKADASAEPPPPDVATAAPEVAQPPNELVLTTPATAEQPATEVPVPVAPHAPAPERPREAVGVQVEGPRTEPTRAGGHRISTWASVVAAIASVIGIGLMVMDQRERRASDGDRRQEAADRHQSDSLTALTSGRILASVERDAEATVRSATTEESLRHVHDSAAAVARRAAADAAEAKARQRRDTVAYCDQELGRRFGVLRDSLTAIGVVNAIRQDASFNWRVGIAWETFLKPNDLSNSARVLMKTVTDLDPGPQAERALIHLDAIADPDRATLYRGPENSRTQTGTMVIEYRDPTAPPGVNERQMRPVAEVVRLLEVPRWASGREPFR